MNRSRYDGRFPEPHYPTPDESGIGPHVWDCKACGEEQTLGQPDYEHTEYCNLCAQLLVSFLKEACENARDYLRDDSDACSKQKQLVKSLDVVIAMTEAGRRIED